MIPHLLILDRVILGDIRCAAYVTIVLDLGWNYLQKKARYYVKFVVIKSMQKTKSLLF